MKKLLLPVVTTLYTATLLCLSTPLFAMSAGYNVDLTDAETVATGGGGFAKAKSPATNWSNPAGLTQLKEDSYNISVAHISVSNELETPSGDRIISRPTRVTIPALHYNNRLNPKWSFGLSFTTAYGSGSEWDDDITKYVSTKTCLKIHNLNPNLAYKINDQISMAAGIDVSYALGNMKKAINQTLLNAGVMQSLTGITTVVPYADASSELDGSGSSLGGNIALFYTPNKKINIGLSYRSPVDIDMTGKVYMRGLTGSAASLFGGTEYETHASLRLCTPATLGMGIAYHVSKKTTLDLNIEWARWSRLEQLHTRYRTETNPVRLAILNTNNPIEKDYDDTFNIGIGINHDFNDKYSAFLGGGYKPSPAPEKAFDTLIVPLDILSIGTGGAVQFKNSSLNLNITYAWGKKRTIDNDLGNSSGASIDGTYKKEVFIFLLSYIQKI